MDTSVRLICQMESMIKPLLIEILRKKIKSKFSRYRVCIVVSLLVFFIFVVRNRKIWPFNQIE